MERGIEYGSELLFLVGDEDLSDPRFGVTGRKIRRHQGTGLRHEKRLALSLSDVTARGSSSRSPHHNGDVTALSCRSFPQLPSIGDDVTRRITNRMDALTPSVSSGNRNKHAKIPGIVLGNSRHLSHFIIHSSNRVHEGDAEIVHKKMGKTLTTETSEIQSVKRIGIKGDINSPRSSELGNDINIESTSENESELTGNNHNEQGNSVGDGSFNKTYINSNLGLTRDKGYDNLEHSNQAIITSNNKALSNGDNVDKHREHYNDANNNEHNNNNNNKNNNSIGNRINNNKNNMNTSCSSNTTNTNTTSNNATNTTNTTTNSNSDSKRNSSNNCTNSISKEQQHAMQDINKKTTASTTINNTNNTNTNSNSNSVLLDQRRRRHLSLLQNLSPLSPLSLRSSGGAKSSHSGWPRTRRPEAHYPYTIVTPVLEFQTGNTTPFIVRGNCLDHNQHQTDNERVNDSSSSVPGYQMTSFETKYRYQYWKMNGSRTYLSRINYNSHRKLGSFSERSRSMAISIPDSSFHLPSAPPGNISSTNTSSSISIPQITLQTSAHTDVTRHAASHPVDGVVSKILQRHHRQLSATSRIVSDLDQRIVGKMEDWAVGHTTDVKPSDGMNVHCHKRSIDIHSTTRVSVDDDHEKIQNANAGFDSVAKSAPVNIEGFDAGRKVLGSSEITEGDLRNGPNIDGSKREKKNNHDDEKDELKETLGVESRNKKHGFVDKTDTGETTQPESKNRFVKLSGKASYSSNPENKTDRTKHVPGNGEENVYGGGDSEQNKGVDFETDRSNIEVICDGHVSNKMPDKVIGEIKECKESGYDASNGNQSQKKIFIDTKDISKSQMSLQKNVDNVAEYDKTGKDNNDNNNNNDNSKNNNSNNNNNDDNKNKNKHNNNYDNKNGSVVKNGIAKVSSNDVTKRATNDPVFKSDRKVSDWIIFRDYKTTGMGGYGDKYNVWINGKTEPKSVKDENVKLALNSDPDNKKADHQSALSISKTNQNLGTNHQLNKHSNGLVGAAKNGLVILNSRRNNNSKQHAQRKQEGTMTGAASKIYWKYTDNMASLRTKNSNRNMFLPCRSKVNETHQWRPTSHDSNGTILQWNQEVIPGSRPSSRNTPRSVTEKNSINNRNDRTFLRIGSAGIPGHPPISNFSFVQRYRPVSREARGSKTSRSGFVNESPRPLSQQNNSTTRRSSPDVISKSDATQFIHEVNGLHGAKPEGPSQREPDSESRQEMLDYFWSYQGMSRQMLGAKSADRRRKDKGAQPWKLNVDTESNGIKQLSPLKISTQADKSLISLEYEENENNVEKLSKSCGPPVDKRTVHLVVKIPDMTSDKE